MGVTRVPQAVFIILRTAPYLLVTTPGLLVGCGGEGEGEVRLKVGLEGRG